MKNTKWIFPKKNPPGVFSNYSDEIISILNNRNFFSDNEITTFLNPCFDNLNDPFGLKDMDLAVERIIKAISDQESIWIYGDYDVDGITSTSLCYLALKRIGAKINYHIPLRDDGYGLNFEALKNIASQKGALVISVDCGITSYKEIEYANNLGLNVIITDHHEIIDNKIPQAFAVINPKRIENTYPFKSLAGVGTAFMLLLALYTKLERNNELFQYIDIVALGTIADIVPLVNDNRIFVKMGLEHLKKTKSPGLKALLKILFFEDYDNKIFSPYDIGFIIAPVFNAAGRLEAAETSVKLLIAESHMEYNNLIDTLIENNQKRKEIQEKILQNCLEKINTLKLYDKNIILLSDESFHHGVIGIVASKILDKYYKPVIILELNKEEGIAKASCRSTESFNMIEALTKYSQFLSKFGGHHAAAGFSIPIENLDKFYLLLDKYCGEITQKEDTLKPLKIESILPLYKVSYNFISKLKQLEPFGFGNPSPIFALLNVTYKDLKLIGKNKDHLSLTLLDSHLEIKNCIWFGNGEYFDEILNYETIDLVFKVKLEEYKNRFFSKIYIEDIKPHDKTLDYLVKKEIPLFYNSDFPIKTIVYSKVKTNSEIVKIKTNELNSIIIDKKNTLGFLDSQTHTFLKLRNTYFKNKYFAKIIKLIETEENFNIFLEIFPDYTFTSYALTDGKLFNDIKNFLIGENDYSLFQKNILSQIFKRKLNFSLQTLYNDELEAVLLTIALYYNYHKKKILIVSNEKISNKLSFFCDTSSIIKKDYDFYIFLNIKHDKICENINYLEIIY